MDLLVLSRGRLAKLSAIPVAAFLGVVLKPVEHA